MKMLPVQLSLNPPLGIWSDVLWRCPPAPPSQLAELKTQLPPSLPSDPRLWGREDVTVFLRFCEREFDLPTVDHDLFQMNGKALCLLTRADFGHRCPGAGDVLHNVLQMLIIEAHMMQWHLPNSPVTPTSRYPLSPHSHPPTPTWPPIAPPESPFHNAAHLQQHHFMAPNSVTLSPPPSVDSQASSPPQGQDQNAVAVAAAAAAAAVANGVANANAMNANGICSNNNAPNHSSSSSSNSSSSGSTASTTSSTTAMPLSSAVANAFMPNIHQHHHHHQQQQHQQHQITASTSSNHSDSDEESYAEAAAKSNIALAAAKYNTSPPTTPILKDMPQSLHNSFVSTWTQNQTQKLAPSTSSGGSVSAPTTPSYMQPVKREFFPENSEPNTNGRLLWDFLQQLLNDRNQKYSELIAWKCRDTGVFKIVDPAGLAKLWGIQKNHLSMNYDKMSRALRYYYRVNILRKVQGERHCYQFLRNPTELKNIKNISLLRQTVANASTTATSTNANATNTANGVGGAGVNQQNNNPQTCSTNMNSTNWSQRPSSRSNGGNNANSNVNGNNANSNNHHMSAAAAAVAAAAAAAYGPPPTSPLFMHAINGAFHYLSSNAAAAAAVGAAPPNSPAASLPPNTPSEKFQFKLESNGHESGEEMKPTDLSVAGSAGTEKRPYSSPSANEDCYPLIRNADGLTTIKLIRCNDNEAAKPAVNQTGNGSNGYAIAMSPKHMEATASNADEQQSQPMHMDSSETVSSHETEAEQYGNMLLPTDLRK